MFSQNQELKLQPHVTYNVQGGQIRMQSAVFWKLFVVETCGEKNYD